MTLFLLVLVACFVYAWQCRNRGAPQVLMVLIPVYSQVMLSTPLGQTNVTNALYAAVLWAVCLSKMDLGKKWMLDRIYSVLGAMLFGTAVAVLLGWQSGQWSWGEGTSVIGVSAASWIAFGAACAVIYALPVTSRSYGPVTVLAQLVDSLIFFGLAFQSSSRWLEMAMAGWAVKSAAHLASWPLLLAWSKKNR